VIAAEIQKLNTSEFVYLFELDLSAIAPDLSGDDAILRFSPMTNELGEGITWGGKVYAAYPIEAEGFELNAQGSPPRPKIRAANIDGAMTGLCLLYQDLVQAKLTRIKLFARHLDAVNFAAGNAEADHTQHYPLDTYYIERRTTENNMLVEWECRWPYDLEGVVIPNFPIVANICPAIYKTPDCSWVPVPGKYFNALDEHCSAGQDDCSHKLTGCKLRFGAKAVLPYNGCPAASVVKG